MKIPSTPVIFAVTAAFLIGLVFICAWTCMLIAGIAHDDWWHLVPAMGFWTSLKISAAWMILGLYSGILKAVGVFFQELAK